MEKENFLDFFSSETRDIVINLQVDKHWSDYVRELTTLQNKDSFYCITFNQKPKTQKGCKCFLSYDDKIYAWLEIYSLNKEGEKFKLELFPYINFIFPKIYNTPFVEEFRYFFENHSRQ